MGRVRIDPAHVLGDFTPARIAVAIVGSRKPAPESRAIARKLAALVVREGGVVVSGGADGIDAEAHEGALEAGGRTWCVLGCGAPNFTPFEQRARDILARGGAVIRPFPEGTRGLPQNYLHRNRVIMTLAPIVVAIQAADRSGTLHASNEARKLGCELWVVPGLGDGFVGSWRLVAKGAKILRHEDELAARLRAPELHGDARLVYETLAEGAKHPDQIVLETGLSTSAVATALLTLALGDVVVEGSAGLYERKILL